MWIYAPSFRESDEKSLLYAQAEKFLEALKKNDDSAEFLIVKNEAENLMKSAYLNKNKHRNWIEFISLNLLESNIFDEKEKTDWYDKFYRYILQKCKENHWDSYARYAMPKLLKVSFLSDEEKVTRSLEFFSLAYEASQNDLYVQKYVIPNLVYSKYLPHEQIRDRYIDYLEHCIQTANDVVDNGERTDWRRDILPDLLEHPILTEEEKQKYYEMASLTPRKTNTNIPKEEKEEEKEEEKKIENDEYFETLVNEKNRRYNNDDSYLAFSLSHHLSQYHIRNKNIEWFKLLTGLDAESYAFLKEHQNQLTPSEILCINDEWIDAFKEEKEEAEKKKNWRLLWTRSTEEIFKVLGKYDNHFSNDPKVESALQYLKRYVSFSDYRDSFAIESLVSRHLDEFIASFEFLLWAEREFVKNGLDRDKEDFWRSRWGSILDTLIHSGSKDSINEKIKKLKDFMKEVTPHIKDKQKLRIFISYYYNDYLSIADQELRDKFIRIAIKVINKPALREKITDKNFFKESYARFSLRNESNLPQREPDYISYVNAFEYDDEGNSTRVPTDKMSSQYRYTDKGVYRKSDHRWRVASCYWALDGNNDYEDHQEKITDEYILTDSSQQEKIEHYQEDYDNENYDYDDYDDYDDEDDDYDYEEDYKDYEDDLVVWFCPRNKFIPMETYYLDIRERLEYDSEDEIVNDSMPLEYLWQAIPAYEFWEVQWTMIKDLNAPLDRHPNHHTNWIRVIKGTEEEKNGYIYT